MTVYVDRVRIPARVGRHDARWSHLTADTEDELHEFAARLGLRRGYFQPGKALGGHPSVAWHYDVTEGKRRQALSMGAQEIELDQWHEIFGHCRTAQAEAASTESRASEPDAAATLADFASERARSAWTAGILVQAARLNRQCIDLDPGRGERWRARPPRQAEALTEVDHLAGFVAKLQPGNRNGGLRWAACRAAEAGVLDADAVEELVQASLRSGIRGGEQEARKTILSALRGRGLDPTRDREAG
jgi:hypothetical protein